MRDTTTESAVVRTQKRRGRSMGNKMRGTDRQQKYMVTDACISLEALRLQFLQLSVVNNDVNNANERVKTRSRSSFQSSDKSPTN